MNGVIIEVSKYDESFLLTNKNGMTLLERMSKNISNSLRVNSQFFLIGKQDNYAFNMANFHIHLSWSLNMDIPLNQVISDNREKEIHRIAKSFGLDKLIVIDEKIRFAPPFIFDEIFSGKETPEFLNASPLSFEDVCLAIENDQKIRRVELGPTMLNFQKYEDELISNFERGAKWEDILGDLRELNEQESITHKQ